MNNSKIYDAFKCLDCKKIQVEAKNRGDGLKCVRCGGALIPIGEMELKG